MLTIQLLHARQILDSRGNPTVEVEATLSDGSFAVAGVPSGASTGKYEAVELRDGDKKTYGGKGVLTAIGNVNGPILKVLKDHDAENQKGVDQLMIDLDGTENKANLGANSILGVSLAVSKAVAVSKKLDFYQYLEALYRPYGAMKAMSLPRPMMNLVNGGSHSDAPIDIQEFMIVPIGAETFSKGLQMGAEIFQSLKKTLSNKGLSTAVGDEGGFAPKLGSSTEVLDLMIEAGSAIGYKAGIDFAFALDAAATEFYDEKTGIYGLTGAGLDFTSSQMVAYYKDLTTRYPIISIEDGMSEDDFEGWALLQKELGAICQIVGDDLFVTNPKRLQMGFVQNLANSILIKLNQIGTLSETFETMAMAQKQGYSCVISHRSGETEDTSIADLAVATGAGQIKTGSLSRTDRICKYNRLLRIEETLSE